MAAPLAPVELVERSRRGDPVDAASVEAFVRAWLDGTASDALMSAWCMAACLHGIDPEQTAALARALVASGDRLELASLGPTGDPQTTGGSGGHHHPHRGAARRVPRGARGQPGRAQPGAHRRRARQAGRDPRLPLRHAPGAVRAAGARRRDRRVRRHGGAWRRATTACASCATRPAPCPRAGLVAASVMSAAIAGGAGAMQVDVKAGPGGLVGDVDEARATALLMGGIAESWGRRLRWTVSDMSRPLGRLGRQRPRGGRGRARCCAARDRTTCASWPRCVAGDLAEAAGWCPRARGASGRRPRCARGDALADGRTLGRVPGRRSGRLDRAGRAAERPGADRRRGSGATGWVEAVEARGIGEVARWLGVGRLCTPISRSTPWWASSCARCRASASARASRWP